MAESKPVFRVAVIGTGPAGFYAAEHLIKNQAFDVTVDLFDRLPTPFGLVRGGVAPDHPKMKTVTRVYDKIANDSRVRFFGNVNFGTHLTREDIRRHYHAVIYTTGAPADRQLNLPGENLARMYAATDFVGWYNGHPDFRDLQFDLSVSRVAVIGVGNVALDVARMLCRTPEELRQTDVADYALEAFEQSQVREVQVLGRRGPAQAAFTLPELKELLHMDDAQAITLPEEVQLDPLSQKQLEDNPDGTINRKVELLGQMAQADHTASTKSRRLLLRFLVSPIEIVDDGTGKVAGLKLVHNELYPSDDGQLRPRATDRVSELAAGAAFRSVGYRGTALPQVPFDERQNIIPNDQGRVLDAGGQQVIGEYTAGWIKRGPSGQIGTNKACAGETVAALALDLEAGRYLQPQQPDPQAIEQLLATRQPDYFTYDDWRRLDQWEMQEGERMGRPRVKLTTVEQMCQVNKRLAEAMSE